MEKYVACALIRAAQGSRWSVRHFGRLDACGVRALAPALSSAVRPFWATDHLQGKPCPLYDCSVNEKHMSNCGACVELPCRKFHDLKDPSVSEQEHMEGIEKRVKTLRAMS